MRVDPARAFIMLKEANPIPDIAALRERRSEEGPSVPPAPTAAKAGAGRVPPRRMAPSPGFVSLLVVAAASIVLAGTIRSTPPDLTGEVPLPPFDRPTEAIQALLMVTNRGDGATAVDLFSPGASLDEYGSTSLWQESDLVRTLDFRSALGVEYRIDDCGIDGPRGICRVLYWDSLLEMAGVPRHAEEWTVTLADDGRIGTLRQRNLDTIEFDQAQAWFVDFNQWLCRHHVDAAVEFLWDRRTVSRNGIPGGGCTAVSWNWSIGRADPELLLRLHSLYIAERDR